MNAKRKCSYKLCTIKYFRQEDGIVKGPNAWCSSECQALHAIANLNKMKVNDERKAKKAKQEVERGFRDWKRKLNETDLKWQKARTKAVLHELVKLLDKYQPCIVCGIHECGQRTEWDAGHYLTKAAHPELKFDPRNIFKQCSGTNTASTGRSSAEASIRQKFDQGIIARYGMAHLMWLKSYHPPVKFTCEGLSAMRAEMAADNARLKKGLPPSREWRQLPTQFNQEESKDG